MDNRKPVYLFAGGRGRGFSQTFAGVRSFIRSIGKAKPDIAYVGVASMEDGGMFYFMSSSLIKIGCNCRLNRVLLSGENADLGKARKMLQSTDAIFMSGGDMEAGMRILEEKDMAVFFRELYKEGKPFFGISAGSIMLAKEWVRWRNPDDDSTAELFPCLGIAPIICDTHAEEDDWEELKTALRLKGDGTVGYGIPSGAYLKVCPDGELEAGGGPVVRYIVQDGKIERRPDLLPVPS
ncbi:MAG: Type 1 glutamine amidotransferase-like domain-containing protein [Dehalococcoidales bacterium]|nr:Type 1 glutamine amidotransferase-like domain-containing protein [Dehalococcoidales bacterium]